MDHRVFVPFRDGNHVDRSPVHVSENFLAIFQSYNMESHDILSSKYVGPKPTELSWILFDLMLSVSRYQNFIGSFHSFFFIPSLGG